MLNLIATELTKPPYPSTADKHTWKIQYSHILCLFPSFGKTFSTFSGLKNCNSSEFFFILNVFYEITFLQVGLIGSQMHKAQKYLRIPPDDLPMLSREVFNCHPLQNVLYCMSLLHILMFWQQLEIIYLSSCICLQTSSPLNIIPQLISILTQNFILHIFQFLSIRIKSFLSVIFKTSDFQRKFTRLSQCSFH